jgi:hypothetical protein
LMCVYDSVLLSVIQADPSQQTRAARFVLVQDTKTGKNVPNEHKMYRMVITYPKYP